MTLPPFTTREFFAVFTHYNDAIWPAQPIAYALGALAATVLLFPGTGGDRVTSGILAAGWLWAGAAYHWAYFAAINGAAICSAPVLSCRRCCWSATARSRTG